MKMERQDEQIAFESLIDTVLTQFDAVAEVYVACLPCASDVSQLLITVHTGDADSLEEYVDVVPESHIVVETGDDDVLRLPFEVLATVDGPGHPQGVTGTTVYMTDTVLGSEERELATGIKILRNKLGGACPICEITVDDLGSHLSANQDCATAERV